jgi:hypothetical protein
VQPIASPQQVATCTMAPPYLQGLAKRSTSGKAGTLLVTNHHRVAIIPSPIHEKKKQLFSKSNGN